jgi:mono/diheme cytochrome c family protein
VSEFSPVRVEAALLCDRTLRSSRKVTGETMKKMFAFAFVITMAASLFAADGATTYKAKCLACHGADGAKIIPALGVKPLNTPAVKAMGAAGVTNIITKGQGKMPAFGGKMSGDEISATAAYVLSLK